MPSPHPTSSLAPSPIAPSPIAPSPIVASPLAARLQIVAAAFLFSTGGMAIKSCGLSEWQIVSFRCGVGALVMWLLLPAARRRWSWRTVVVGAAYAATLTLFVLANKATTAAHAIFLQSTAPLYLLLLAPLVLGERIRGRDLLTMAAMAGGLVLLLSDQVASSTTAPAPLRGDVLAALAGLTWALTLVGFRWLDQSGGAAASAAGEAPAAVVAGNVIGFVAALPQALPVVASEPADWLWVLFLGVFQVALPYVFLTAGMRSVPAFEAALLLLIEPVFNPVWAFWVHGEQPGPRALVGGAVIVLVTLLTTWLDVHTSNRRAAGRRVSARARGG